VVDVNGTPTCQSVIDGTDPACVPIDVFQANGITSAQAKYLFSNSNTASRNSLRQVTAGINGDLGTFGIKSPWATNGVAIALGAENRKETLLFTADAVAKQGGTNDSDGEISVWEGFGEIEVPLLENMPFAHKLTLNGGLRYSSYTNDQLSSGNHSAYRVWTYKGELTWAPDTSVRLRTSYNRAIRAPNIAELFNAQSVGNVAGRSLRRHQPDRLGQRLRGNRRGRIQVWHRDHPVPGRYLLALAGAIPGEAGKGRHHHRGPGADPAGHPQLLDLAGLLPHQGEGLHRHDRSFADRVAVHFHR
jgi:hypothetical protein